MSFMPHHFLNDTWIYNSTNGYCSADTAGDGQTEPDGTIPSESFCITYRGGLYDTDASSTFESATDVYDAGGDPSDTERALGTHIWDGTWANDEFAFGDTSFDSFAFGMPGHDFGGTFDTQNNIGMGINSTFLNALQEAGKIASQSWSWWWGQTGASDDIAMDGSIVFGGYDKAKTTGSNYTQRLASPRVGCPSGMEVTVTSMTLNFINGTQANILDPSQITTCLQPDFTVLMTLLQSPYYDNFETFSNTKNIGRGGGNGIGARGMLYKPGQVFDGSLTISLNGVFDVDIPNYLLVVPPQHVADDGSIFTDTSTSEVLLDPLGGDNSFDSSILGRPFFSAAYLNVDYDVGTFTLWKANPTVDSDLVPLGGDCEHPKVNAPPNSLTNGSSSSADSSDSQDSQSNGSEGLSTGAIAGIVVGMIVVIATVAVAAVVWCMRKRARRRTAIEPSASESAAMKLQTPQYDHCLRHPQSSEAMSSHLQEMEGRRDPQELGAEVRPSEVPNERAHRVRQKRLLLGMNSPVELA